MRRKNKIIIFIICVVFCMNAVSFALPSKDLATFETMATQTVSSDELTSPYSITGESLVNVIRGMVDFDAPGSSIVFNRRSGQLFVRHTPTNQRAVEKVIRHLRDASFKQVEIEARLVTVAATDFKGFGVDFGGLNFSTEHRETQIGTSEKTVKGSGSYGSFVDFASFVDGISGTQNGAQFSFASLGGLFDIDIAIDALESRTEVNTLATPRLTVFNNQRAHLKIEKRQNFVSEVDANFDTVSGDSGARSVWFQVETKVKQAQSGTILDVTPTINSDGTIGLDLHPDYVTADLTSNVQTITNKAIDDSFTNSFVLPVFVSQSVDTFLTIPNGGVAVLGGLITEEEVKSFRKVPVLGDIPWVGKMLFSQEQVQNERSILLIFVKAKIKDIFEQ